MPIGYLCQWIFSLPLRWFLLVKLYPESNAEARLNLRGGGYLYIYCNKHGLMKKKI